MYIGSWAIDNLVTFTVTTHDPATGALVDADSVPSYRVYENETGTAILSGTMALLDDANTTGHYSEQITLSAANGFEKGKSYNIYIAAVVGGVTGGTTRCLQVEAEVDANRLNWANVDNPTTVVGLSGTTVKTATDVETDTADIQSRIGTPSNLGGGATVAANLADIEAQTDDIAGSFTTVNGKLDTIDDLLDTEVGTINTNVSTLVTRLGTPSDLGSGATIADNLTDIDAAAGGGLDAAGVRAAVGLASANLDTQLDALPTNAELATALAAADDAVLTAIDAVPTNAELTTALTALQDALEATIAALNNLSAAQVNAEVVDALTVDVIADSVPADGSRPTLAQAALMIARFLMEKSVSGTTVTVNKEDGSTAAMTFTLDDASSPTSISRAS